MANLSVEINGLALRNPILPGAGPQVDGGEKLAAVAHNGAGGLVTRTISVLPAPDNSDHAALHGGYLSRPAWSAIPVEQWAQTELPAARRAADAEGIPLIVSLGYNAAEIEQLLPLVSPWADGIELATHFLRPDRAPMRDAAATIRAQNALHSHFLAHDPQPLVEAVQAAKASFAGPVWVKLSPWGQNEVLTVARAAVDAGADALVATDTLGPTLAIDIEQGRPLLDGDGYGWLSGVSLRPTALRVVFDLAKELDVPVIGSGGVSRPEDAVEMFMAGATAAQVTSEAIRRGARWYGRLAEQVDRWLNAHNKQDIAAIRGEAIRHWQALLPHTISTPPLYVEDACIGCKLCELSCHYHAIWMEGLKAVLNPDLCFGCGLCVARCPTEALTMPRVQRNGAVLNPRTDEPVRFWAYGLPE